MSYLYAILLTASSETRLESLDTTPCHKQYSRHYSTALYKNLMTTLFPLTKIWYDVQYLRGLSVNKNNFLYITKTDTNTF